MHENQRNDNLESVIAHALHLPPPWIREDKELRPSHPEPPSVSPNKLDKTKENKSCCKTIWSHCKCLRVGLILMAVIAVIIIVHQEATHTKSSKVSSANKSFNPHFHNISGDMWLEIPNSEYWAILENVTKHTDSACAVIHAAQRANWKVLVLEDNLPACCLFNTCIHLPSSWLRQKARFYAMTLHFSEPSARKALYKNVAFLHTLYHGASYVFDVGLLELDEWGCPLEHAECEKILTNQLLQITSKKQKKSLIYTAPYTQRIYEPMQHFGCSDCWPKGYDPLHQGKVFNDYYLCQSPEPLVVKLFPLDRVLDSTAPSITIPPGIFSPFLTSNTIYNRQALWSTLIFPDIPMSTALLLRSFWMHAIFDRFGHYIKFSGLPALKTSKLQTGVQNKSTEIHHEPSVKFFEKSAELTVFLLQWSCGANILLVCVLQLGHDLHYSKYISAGELTFLHSWVNDLKKVDHPKHEAMRTKASNSKRSPCRGSDPRHIHFYPAYPLWEFDDSYQQQWQKDFHKAVNQLLLVEEEKELVIIEDPSHNNTHEIILESDDLNLVDKLSDTIAHPDSYKEHASHIWDDRTKKSSNSHGDLEASGQTNIEQHVLEKLYLLPQESEGILSEVAEILCPGFQTLFPYTNLKEFRTFLLIIVFPLPHYDAIPYLEVTYRNYFPNILYCGIEDESIDIFARKFQLFESRSFSFFPVSSPTATHCLQGAIDMGYNVQHYLVTQWNSLLFPPPLTRLPLDKVWVSVINDPEGGSSFTSEAQDHLLSAIELLKAEISRHIRGNSSRVRRKTDEEGYDFHDFKSLESVLTESSEQSTRTSVITEVDIFGKLDDLNSTKSLVLEAITTTKVVPEPRQIKYISRDHESVPVELTSIEPPSQGALHSELEYSTIDANYSNSYSNRPLSEHNASATNHHSMIRESLKQLKALLNNLTMKIMSNSDVSCGHQTSCSMLLEFSRRLTTSEDTLLSFLEYRTVPAFLIPADVGLDFVAVHDILIKSKLTEAQVLGLLLFGLTPQEEITHLSIGVSTKSKSDLIYPYDMRQLTTSSAELKRSFCIDYLAASMAT